MLCTVTSATVSHCCGRIVKQENTCSSAPSYVFAALYLSSVFTGHGRAASA